MKKALLPILTFALFISCSNSSKQKSNSVDSLTASSKNAVILKKKDSLNKNEWIFVNTDKVRGDKYLMAVDPIIIANQDTSEFIKITFAKPIPGKTFWVNFLTYGGGSCIDKGGEIDILFDDSTRTKIYNHFKFNCDMMATEYFKGSYSNNNSLKMLETKRINIIRVYTYKSSVTLNFSRTNSYDFINTINWIDKGKS